LETNKTVGLILIGTIVFSVALFAVVGSRLSNPFSSQILNSYQFDPASSFNYFEGFSCFYAVLTAPTPWCPGSGSIGYSPAASLSPGQSSTIVLGDAGGYFDQISTSNGCSGGFPVCAIGQAIMGGTSRLSSTYGITASMSASNFQLIGSTANANWQNQFNENIPTNSTGVCPFTVIPNGCNPYTVTLGTGNSTIYYNIYRFAFTIVLQTVGDRVTASTSCSTGTFGDARLCPQQEISALNQALSFINGGDQNKGTLLADIAIPDPFYYSSFGAATADQYGIVGTWIGGSSGCSTSTINFGAVFSVSPCLSHVVVTNNKLVFTPASNEPSLTSYSSSNLPTGSLNPNAQLSFNLNKLQIHYQAVPCSSGSGVNCPAAGAGDCIANGECVIQSDSGVIVQIPLVLDVIGSGPNLQKQASNIGKVTSTGTAAYNPLLGNIIVTVKDSVLQLPVVGVPVNYGSGSTCATSNSYGTTNNQGQVPIIGLSPGAYTVCTTGQTGYVTLIFVSFTFLYSLASQQLPGGLGSGQTVQVTLYLQPSFSSELTEISIIIVVLAVVVLGVAWVATRGGVTDILVKLKDFTSEKILRR
jgi:hypothetical protein